MKGDFLSLAKSRKTTYEFDRRQIPNSALTKILEAGRWAPSCVNIQPWHFIVVKNKKRIKQMMMTTNYGDFHTDPPVIVALVLLRKRCLGRDFLCFKGNGSVHDSFMCIGMSALNMALEACYLAINSCLITPSPNEIKSILKVNQEDEVPLMVGFGYQKKGAFQKERERDKLKSIISYEVFRSRKNKR